MELSESEVLITFENAEGAKKFIPIRESNGINSAFKHYLNMVHNSAHEPRLNTIPDLVARAKAFSMTALKRPNN